MPTLNNLPPHIYIFAAILGTLLFAFLIFSVFPSFIVGRRLARVNKKLRALNGRPNDTLDLIFEQTGILEHLWREYSDTLHRQGGELGEGGMRFRSTLPANMIFRPEILVDIPVRTDFFKHLPGLFTGVGIIGTFYGLLVGLQTFVISDNPIIVRSSLTQLLHGVSEAFMVSAAAITLAMLVTFIEKLILTRLNGQAEKLVQLLDGLFESGAGEEYLARLVRASETSAAQNSGLVQGELKEVLTALFELQMQAAQATSLQLGDRIVHGLEKDLKTPLAEIAANLQNIHQESNRSDETILARLMEEFSNKIMGLFGGQVSSIQSLQQQTLSALQSTVQMLTQMSTEMGEAGQRNSSAMAEQLAESIAAAEARQRIMNEQLTEFVAQMRAMVEQSQSAGQSQLQTTLNEISERMASMIETLSTQVRSTTDATLKNQQTINDSSQQAATQIGAQMSAVTDGVNQAVTEMRAVVAAMRSGNNEAITKLNNGADTLYLAAKDFAKAGDGVSATLQKSSVVVGQLTQAADAIAAASGGLSGIFSDYQSARDSMMNGIGALQAIMEQLKRDASMSGDVLARIEAATQKLAHAQKDADRYLSGVSEVLATAHSSFSEGMSKAVGEANRDFHQALSDSVKLLREGIQELESTLDNAGGI